MIALFPCKTIKKKYEAIDDFQRERLKKYILTQSNSQKNNHFKIVIQRNRSRIIGSGVIKENDNGLEVKIRFRYELLFHIMFILFLIIFGFMFTGLYIISALNERHNNQDLLKFVVFWWSIYGIHLIVFNGTASEWEKEYLDDSNISRLLSRDKIKI